MWILPPHTFLSFSPLFFFQVPKNLAYLQFGYHCTMIALFGQFFYETYYVSEKKEKKPQQGTLPDASKEKVAKGKKSKSPKA